MVGANQVGGGGRATRRGILAAAGAGLVRPARAQAAAWRIVTEYPATAIPGEGIAAFAQAVGELSGGALAVAPAFDAPGGLRSAGMLAATAAHQVEAADAFTGALGGASPLFQVSALPFLTASAADAGRLWRAAEPAYRRLLEDRGLVLLYATPWPPTGIWSREALAGPASLAGLRIRTYDAASTAVFQGVGAAPVLLSFADAAPRLQAGALDAVLSSGDGGAGARLWDVLPHFAAVDYAFPLSLAFCGRAALDALPARARAAVMEAGPATTARQFAAMATRVAENEARMAAHGVQLGRAPAVRAALAEAAVPVIADWEVWAGDAGAAILAAYRAG